MRELPGEAISMIQSGAPLQPRFDNLFLSHMTERSGSTQVLSSAFKFTAKGEGITSQEPFFVLM